MWAPVLLRVPPMEGQRFELIGGLKVLTSRPILSAWRRNRNSRSRYAGTCTAPPPTARFAKQVRRFRGEPARRAASTLSWRIFARITQVRSARRLGGCRWFACGLSLSTLAPIAGLTTVSQFVEAAVCRTLLKMPALPCRHSEAIGILRTTQVIEGTTRTRG
jgi:hypothetical protein